MLKFHSLNEHLEKVNNLNNYFSFKQLMNLYQSVEKEQDIFDKNNNFVVFC
jgi:hypothetical protein